MKTLYSFLLGLCFITTVHAQTLKADKRAPIVHFLLADSTVVSGRIVQQDSVAVVVEKRNGDLTYLPPGQIVRQVAEPPRTPNRRQPITASVTSFSLKDGATVSGQVVERTPVAVIVRLANGSRSYIDPNDILRTETTTPTTALVEPAEQPLYPVGAPYLLSSRTAFTPRAGTVYYRNTYLIRNEAEVGLTNGWSVGVVYNPRFDNLPNVSGYMSRAIYNNAAFGTQFYTRAGFPIGSSVRLTGALSMQLQRYFVFVPFSPTIDQRVRATYQGQVLASFGKPHSNLTLGYTFEIGDDYGLSQTPGTLTIGTIQHLGRSLTFVSDNTIRVRNDSFNPLARLSAALRIRNRFHAFDLGVLSTVTAETSFVANLVTYRVYPYLGYTVQFGGRK